jgi:hypothetical protein
LRVCISFLVAVSSGRSHDKPQRAPQSSKNNLELNRGSPSGWAEWIASINFLHFAIVLVLLCAAVLVIVSLATHPPDAARVVPLTIRLADWHANCLSFRVL